MNNLPSHVIRQRHADIAFPPDALCHCKRRRLLLAYRRGTSRTLSRKRPRGGPIMSQLAPLNLHAWIDEHRHLLKPPVGNAAIWNSNFLVMIVGGPNQRSDYHVNPGEELFYQIEGDIVLKVIEDGKPRDIPVKQGEIFLLPARVPHSPQRPANTVGLVVEQPKCSTEDHHLRWYCRRCNAIV